jgi:hypothetical protein
MFIALFIASFALALAVAAGVAWLSKDPIEVILHRFLAAHICVALSKYLRFAIVVVGIASGTRVRALEEYIGASSWNKTALTAALTQEIWVLELYRTLVGTLEGIVWLLLAVAFFVLLAILIIRKGNMKQLQPGEEYDKSRDSENRVRMLR